MQKFKKQIAFLFGAIAMISYLSVRYFPLQEPSTTPVIATENEGSHMQIYMMDEHRTLIPLSIPISEESDQEDKLQLMFSYMSGKQEVKGFQPLFTKECKLKNIVIEDGIAYLSFDDSFLNYKAEDELRILEAITWGTTQFHDIEQVKLLLHDKPLAKMPVANTPVPNVLNRSIGINHFETSTGYLHASETITVFYTKKIQGQEYMVPKSKRITSTKTSMRAKVNAILEDISVSSNLEQPLYANDIKIEDMDIQEGNIKLDLNKNMMSYDKSVKENVFQSLVLSLAALPNIKKIEISVDGVAINLPDVVSKSVSITDLTYNVIAF